MMLTTADLEEMEYQLTRKDPEAIILYDYIYGMDRICKMENLDEDESEKLEAQVLSETLSKLNVTQDELFHKLDIITGVSKDDEREWREQKYGKDQ